MQLVLARPPRRNASDAGLSVPPLGLAYIAAMARSLGHDVQIIDAYATGMSWHEFEREIARIKPQVLGFSAMTPIADVVARAVSVCRPHAGKIVLGGPHPTAVGDAVFDEMPGLDAAVVGEGEPVIGPLLNWWASDTVSPPPPGVRTRHTEFTAATPMDPSGVPSAIRASAARSGARDPPQMWSTKWKNSVSNSALVLSTSTMTISPSPEGG